MEKQVRIDKWLWAVRIFKTRSIASEACKKGHVSIGNSNAKPSRNLKEGEIVKVKKTPVTYSFKVLGLIEKRVGAKLVPEYMVNVTPKEEMEVLEMQRYMSHATRDRGTGRPTKKERRDIDQFTDMDDDMTYDFDEI